MITKLFVILCIYALTVFANHDLKLKESLTIRKTNETGNNNSALLRRFKRSTCASSCAPLTRATVPAFDGMIASDNLSFDYGTDADGCPTVDITCIGGEFGTLQFDTVGGGSVTLAMTPDGEFPDVFVLEAQIKCYASGWAAEQPDQTIAGGIHLFTYVGSTIAQTTTVPSGTTTTASITTTTVPTTTTKPTTTTVPTTTTTTPTTTTTTPTTTTTVPTTTTAVPTTTTTVPTTTTTVPTTTTTVPTTTTTVPTTTTTVPTTTTTVPTTTTTVPTTTTTVPTTTTTVPTTTTTVPTTTTTVPTTTTTVPTTTTTVPTTTTTVPTTTTTVPTTTTTVPTTTTTTPTTTTTVPTTTTTVPTSTTTVPTTTTTIPTTSTVPTTTTTGTSTTSTVTTPTTTDPTSTAPTTTADSTSTSTVASSISTASTTTSTASTDTTTERTTTIPTTVVETDCCPTGGFWSEWVADAECATPCGSCSQQVFRRKCLSDASCPCSGSDVKVKNCNIGVCYFPYDSCCPGYNATVIDGHHACGPQPVETPTVNDKTCCPTGGFWGTWGEWSTCTGGTCGTCTGSRTRTRECASSDFCACDVGDATETETCRALATWSEWTTTDVCNQTACGACQKLNYVRTCAKTNGCFCMGEETKTVLCNLAPCATGTVTCCSSLSVETMGGLSYCGPLPDEKVETEVLPCETTTPACCVLGGVWSEWSTGDACNDTCGNCGTSTRSRVCLSEDYSCPCSGPTTKQADCAPKQCPFPRQSCCGRRAKIIVGKQFVCSTLEDSDVPPSTLCATDCCPSTGGYWSEWSTGASCETTCGSCSKTTQKRVCLSPSTCPCIGSDTQLVNCGIDACPSPNVTCCAGFSETLIDGKNTCGPQPVAVAYAPYNPDCTQQTCCPETGLWSEWTVTPLQCMDYCGSCGNQTKTRTCLSAASGCPCTGESTIVVQCGINACNFPRMSCCPGLTATVRGSYHVCGPAINNTEPEKLNTCGATCCPSKGIWSDWVSTAPCSDVCGLCGNQTRTRKCLSQQYGCPCVGDSTSVSVCGTAVCLYPRQSCCTGFTKMVNYTSKSFHCSPLVETPAVIPEQTTCCDPEKTGLWNDWTEWSICSATCGGCGTHQRNRTCASEAYGCPCTGNSLETESCGKVVCSSGSQCCTGKFLATGYDGTQYCQDSPPAVCSGVWSEWIIIEGSICNDTCGMCGTTTRNRYCFPSGCQCSGSFTSETACASKVCTIPRQSCCNPYVKKIVNKSFVCG